MIVINNSTFSRNVKRLDKNLEIKDEAGKQERHKLRTLEYKGRVVAMIRQTLNG
jgi:hypothetical protein